MHLTDERCAGGSIDVCLNGTLRDEQKAAFGALSAHDTGILSATTAFGKTVIGAAMIAEKKVNTLIFVHRLHKCIQAQTKVTVILMACAGQGFIRSLRL